VQRLTAWASTTESGDRDDLKPGVADRPWAQVSVSSRECLGMARCPFGTECFAERARATAGGADIVVTNHALLAIDAVADSAVLPEHRLLIVDEAHDLVDRVTAMATGELTATLLGIASRRITRLVEPELMQRWERASTNFTAAIQDATAGRIDHLDDELATHLTALPTIRCCPPGSARWPPAAATVSWPSLPATPRCCWPRAPGGSCVASTTEG
jgi:ATP-dependent DNA helicase DinG